MWLTPVLPSSLLYKTHKSIQFYYLPFIFLALRDLHHRTPVMHTNCLLVLTQGQFSVEMIYPCILVFCNKSQTQRHSGNYRLFVRKWHTRSSMQDIRIALNRTVWYGLVGQVTDNVASMAILTLRVWLLWSALTQSESNFYPILSDFWKSITLGRFTGFALCPSGKSNV